MKMITCLSKVCYCPFYPWCSSSGMPCLAVLQDNPPKMLHDDSHKKNDKPNIQSHHNGGGTEEECMRDQRMQASQYQESIIRCSNFFLF